jgi:methylthioribose-1-phosphate isomerase
VAIKALQWTNGRLRLLDQTHLPGNMVYVELERWPQVVEAIQALRVRGAPALGVAGAYALVLAAQEYADQGMDGFQERLNEAARHIARARPTAVNLSWAVRRTLRVAQRATDPSEAMGQLLTEAKAIQQEEEEASRRMGEHGATLVPREATLLTHCNTGALATMGSGTALAVVRAAWAQGKVRRVIVTETRPLLQGARLTTWELLQDGIPVTLVVDGAAGHMLRQGDVSAVVVGADRIAANGDVANKVGTYTLAVVAQAHNVPFYVAAPLSTVDLETPTGTMIPIEERDASEVTSFGGVATAPSGVTVCNPAFDVTPAALVSAIVTEAGVIRPPYPEGLRRVKGPGG